MKKKLSPLVLNCCGSLRLPTKIQKHKKEKISNYIEITALIMIYSWKHNTLGRSIIIQIYNLFTL